MAIIEQNYKIGVNHVGKNCKISNRGILDLLENVAFSHSDLAGYGCTDIARTHLSWVLLHWKVEVLQRVCYGEKILIKTWARNAHKFFTLRDFEIYDENQNLICIASSKWSLINADTASITRITDDILSAYEIEEKSVFQEDDIVKLKEPILSENPAFSFRVLRRDIDFNQHMHNLYYLDYACEALPETSYNHEEKNHLEIMYKTGAKLGSYVDCYYTCEPNAEYVVMKSKQTDRLHAIVKLY